MRYRARHRVCAICVRFVCVDACVWPVAPLWQTLQDFITQAELVVSLTAVDALQSDLHQLVWVPNNLLLALEERRIRVSMCISMCDWPRNLFVPTHWSIASIEAFSSSGVFVCVWFMASNGPETCPWLRPYGVINTAFTAQGQQHRPWHHTNSQSCNVCVDVLSFSCLSIYGYPSVTPTTLVHCVCVCIRILASGLECLKMMRGRVRSSWARLTRYSLSRDLAEPSFCPSQRCRNGTIHWKESFT